MNFGILFFTKSRNTRNILPRINLRGNKRRNNDRIGGAHPNCLLAHGGSRPSGIFVTMYLHFRKKISRRCLHPARSRHDSPRRKEGREGGGVWGAWTKLLFYSGNFTHFLFARSHRCISLVAALWSSLRLLHPRTVTHARARVCTGCFAKDVTRFARDYILLSSNIGILFVSLHL